MTTLQRIRMRLQERRRTSILIVVGLATLTLRLLLDSRFGHSAAVYVAVPFAVALALHLLVGRTPGATALQRYANHMRDATVVMLATSAVLFEGFLCVLYFMPIYYGIVTLVFLLDALHEHLERRRRARLLTPAGFIVLALMSLEGLSGATSFERDMAVSATRVVDAPPRALLANMAQPFAFGGGRPWAIAIFPLPDAVETGSLEVGDLHRFRFVYRKWFVTNDHTGTLAVRIAEVSERRVRTEVVENSAYFSHYMAISGTTVDLAPLPDGSTRVTLTVAYRRLLDPAWYFGPLQRLAVSQSAAYLIDTIIARSTDDG